MNCTRTHTAQNVTFAGDVAQRVTHAGGGARGGGSRAGTAAGLHGPSVLCGDEARRLPPPQVPVCAVLQEVGLPPIEANEGTMGGAVSELDPRAAPFEPSASVEGGEQRGGTRKRCRSQRARARGGRAAGARQRAQTRRNASRRSRRRLDGALKWGMWCVETQDVESIGWLCEEGGEWRGAERGGGARGRPTPSTAMGKDVCERPRVGRAAIGAMHATQSESTALEVCARVRGKNNHRVGRRRQV